MDRVALEPIYVLHTRPYRNSSLLVDAFTRAYGRITLIARSARGLRSRYQGKLQCFMPLLATWSGKSDLKSLTQLETNALPFNLNGTALLSGFYLNELLIRLLQCYDPHVQLFAYYEKTLGRLADDLSIDVALRYFEKYLLEQLGYGLQLDRDIVTGDPLHPDYKYRFIVERGFVKGEPHEFSRCISGHSLIALRDEQLEGSIDATKELKPIMRYIIAYYLGDKPLMSRALFS